MNIIIYFLSGVLLSLLFQFIDQHFTTHIFSERVLIIGRFIYKYTFLSLFLPLIFSFLLTIILKTDSRITYVLPGFFASFCIIWPKIYAPEILPLSIIKKRNKRIFLYVWLILVFSIFSYVGGEFGRRLIFPYQQMKFDPTTSYVTWLIIGFALLSIKKNIKL